MRRETGFEPSTPIFVVPPAAAQTSLVEPPVEPAGLPAVTLAGLPAVALVELLVGLLG